MQYLEVADVARKLNITPAGVRELTKRAQLRIAATTPRGVRLFWAGDVSRLRRRRAVLHAIRRITSGKK